jgi:hypothetical protein
LNNLRSLIIWSSALAELPSTLAHLHDLLIVDCPNFNGVIPELGRLTYLYYSCTEPHLKILGSEASQTIADVRMSHTAKEITTWRQISA